MGRQSAGEWGWRGCGCVALAVGMLVCSACGPDSGGPARRSRASSGASEESAALRALPYATWVPAGEESGAGVLRNLPGAAPGLNLYSPLHLPEARLMRLDGEVVHRWRLESQKGIQHVELLPGGEILVLVENKSLTRLDWDSRVLWTWEADVHHDVAVAADENEVVVPIRRSREVELGGEKLPILDQELVTLSAGGEPIARAPLWDLFADRVSSGQIEAIRRWMKNPAVRRRSRQGAGLRMNTPPDVMHLNSVEIVSRDVAGVAQRGDLLLSMRHLDLIAVIDRAGTKVRWAWGAGILDGPHHPSLLEDGHVLLFDNGWKRKWSRALEIVPASHEMVWQHPPQPDPQIFSRTRGSTQRLANGDTLVTVSDAGRAFEVTPEGDVVWDFLVPDVRTHPDTGEPERSAVYRMRRFSPAELERLGVIDKLRRDRRAGASVSAAGS